MVIFLKNFICNQSERLAYTFKNNSNNAAMYLLPWWSMFYRYFQSMVEVTTCGGVNPVSFWQGLDLPESLGNVLLPNSSSCDFKSYKAMLHFMFCQCGLYMNDGKFMQMIRKLDCYVSTGLSVVILLFVISAVLYFFVQSFFCFAVLFFTLIYTSNVLWII